MSETNKTIQRKQSNSRPKKAVQATRFASEYIKHSMNGTHAMLAINPDLTRKSAGTLANRMLNTVEVQTELERLNDMVEVSAIRTRADIINRFEHLSGKAEQAKQYTAAISATKEVGTLSRVYDQEDNEASNYNTFIGNLTVNQVTNSNTSGDSTPDSVELEADWTETLDNQVVTEED